MKISRLIPIFASFMLLVFAGCVKENAEVSVRFKSTAYELKAGETLDLAAELKVSNSSAKPAWQSSDPSVASVGADGVLTALAAGEADIKAVVEGKAAVCAVKVVDLVAEKITIKAPESLSSDGSWGSVTAEVEPAGFNAANLEWTFTPSDAAVDFEYEKVGQAEYRLRFNAFSESGAVTVKVADRNSDVVASATVNVTEKSIPATKISLTMPSELTCGGIRASVKASVEPAEYDMENLVWEFKPSSEALGFSYEKVSASEYKVSFVEYVAGGSVTVSVSDGLSQVFNQGRIKVRELPDEGLRELRISPENLVLNEGDEPVALSVVYAPENYDKALLEWTSSDETVAVVDGGVITVVGVGETVIKVDDLLSDMEASCVVKVVVPIDDAQIKRIDLSSSVLDMRVGEDAVQLVAKCYDEAGNPVENYSGLVWSADSMTGESGYEVKVVEVSQKGIVTPKNAGSTQVVVADRNNSYVRAVCNVTVMAAEIKVTDVKLLPSAKTIQIGEEFSLTSVVVPENAENKTLVYASSDEKVAVVSQQGVVTGIAGGEAVISATSANGIKGVCRVTVEEETGVFLSDTKLTLSVGQEKQLTAVVKPSDASQTVAWSSSASDVVSVDGGLIKALKEGEAVITATVGEMSAACEVSVVAGEVNFEIILVPENENVLTAGLMQDKSVRLNAFYTRVEDGSDYLPVSTGWVSSDKSIATVDAEGNVTAVVEHIEESGFENGVKVIITHTADQKSKSFELTVVKALPESIVMTAVPEVDGVKYRMMHGDTFTFEAKVLPEKAEQSVWFAGGGFLQLQNNTFTATNVGVEEFTAYASANTEARLKFSIEVLPVYATEMTISNTALDMTAGSSAALTVAFTPSNASYQDVTWSSSDEDVAVVNENGVVTAKGEGTASITALQSENDMSRTCTVTVSAPDYTYNIGDYYYSTGMISSKPDEDESVYGKVIGVIFSTDNPVQQGDTKLAADYSGCTHGYVISTAEYASQLHNYDFSKNSLRSWVVANGYDCANTNVANGYSNTSAYAEYNNSDFTLFNSVDGPVAEHTALVPAPSLTSTWYIPSYKEMLMLHENMETVNASLEAVSGTKINGSGAYWQSTFYEDNWGYYHAYAFDMSQGGWTSTVKGIDESLPVRIILAF